MKRFYLDTSIWIDYFEDRKDGTRPLGEFAFNFLRWCRNNNHQILYSDLVINELLGNFSEKEIKDFFLPFKELSHKVKISKEQLSEAEKLELNKKSAHKSDILHAILARDNCAVVVARDRHFDYLLDIVEVLKPEEAVID